MIARMNSSVTLLYLSTSSCIDFYPSPLLPVLSSCLSTRGDVGFFVSRNRIAYRSSFSFSYAEISSASAACAACAPGRVGEILVPMVVSVGRGCPSIRLTTSRLTEYTKNDSPFLVLVSKVAWLAAIERPEFFDGMVDCIALLLELSPLLRVRNTYQGALYVYV